MVVARKISNEQMHFFFLLNGQALMTTERVLITLYVLASEPYKSYQVSLFLTAGGREIG